MNFKPDSFMNLLGLFLLVALATTVLMRGSSAARVISAAGSAFSGSIRAATGQG